MAVELGEPRLGVSEPHQLETFRRHAEVFLDLGTVEGMAERETRLIADAERHHDCPISGLHAETERLSAHGESEEANGQEKRPGLQWRGRLRWPAP